MLQTSSDAHDHVMRFTTLNMDSLMLHDQHGALNGSILSLKLLLLPRLKLLSCSIA